MSNRGHGTLHRPFGRGYGNTRDWGGGEGMPGSKKTHSGICRHFQSTGSCKFGSACRFSHVRSLERGATQSSEKTFVASRETQQQQQVRDEYHHWKRIIKVQPRTNYESPLRQVWDSALAILDSDEREWKQMVARDLDNEEYSGRAHIKMLLAARTVRGNFGAYIQLVRPFLLVMTHSAFMDCLSVDNAVGALYNFISGTNGVRAVPFFQHVCESLVNLHVETMSLATEAHIGNTLAATTTALREVLRRDSRARFNDDVPVLVESIQNAVQVIIGPTPSLFPAIILAQLGEVRAMAARAKGQLTQEQESEDLRSPTTTSVYSNMSIVPRNRHDNDKADITAIKIFPTCEEILSDEVDFLPSTDPDQPHFLSDPAERHLDTHFRLLRHDTFGQLKELLGNVMLAADEDPLNPRLEFGDFRVNQYSGAHISFINLDSRQGLEFHISFHQPATIRRKSPSERRKWWEESRRLTGGVLLSFITLHAGVVQHLFFIVTVRNTDNNKDYSLTKAEYQATITAKMASHDQADVKAAINLSCQKTRGMLIEFPGILPATFMPILENLQDMQRHSRLPFRQWIVPDSVSRSQEAAADSIPPPLFARKAGFKFALSPLLKPETAADQAIYIDPASAADDNTILDDMEARTHLDRGQCEALIAALTREFAFIQGPPGTGKSYLGVQLMKVIMHLKQTISLGPVVIVCYTNHALDQFLEHLLAIGINRIIRIGSQSQSTLLDGHNLRKVSPTERKTRSEGYLLHQQYDALDRLEERVKKSLSRMHGAAKQENWPHLRHHLLKKYPAVFSQFRQVGEDGFTAVGRHPFELWASGANASSRTGKAAEAQLDAGMELDIILQKATIDVYSLSHQDRLTLLQLWTQEVQNQAMGVLLEDVEEADSSFRQITKIHDEIDRRVLQNADVIGVTSTGLAKRIATLKRVQCKVVICEEAGEVMEAHMLCALLPTIEHIIQIGDHEQLRPQINHFDELSLESKKGARYKLDRSQFERLSVGEPRRMRVPVAQLNVQRRMRPEISMLIRETIYPKLKDHPSTLDLPAVVGLRKSVYWLDHKNYEEGQHSEVHHKSHSNSWEVEMVRGLVRHVVRQGAYKSSDIAVLTPYTGQLQKLRSVMRNDFEILLSDRDQDALEKDGFAANTRVIANADEETESLVNKKSKAPLQKRKLSELLRIATVDNFQGEEAKVVIVSLVRSNNKKKVGFLKTTNRINVLLSRARHGMYLIGNADTYSHVPMWQKVIDMLQNSESCGTKHDVRVDLLELSTYAEIDVEQTPIVALQCGHFFTAESLDGHIGMSNVYRTNPCGRFTGLVDISRALATTIPRCPDCQRPIRQYTTQRYNRVINRAVIDELTRRFLLDGKAELNRLECRLADYSREMDLSRPVLINSVKNENVTRQLQRRYEPYHTLYNAIGKFLHKVADDRQPAGKLYQAQVYATKVTDTKSLTETLDALTLQDSVPPVQCDRRILRSGRMLQIRTEFTVLEDKFSIAKASASTVARVMLPGVSLDTSTTRYLQTCGTFIRDCGVDMLPKLAVEASLYFAHGVSLRQSAGLSIGIDQARTTQYAQDARDLLEKAMDLCNLPFQNADQLRAAAEESVKLLRREWYEELSPEELASIKQAMVTGPGGFATHSGHWYNCVKGHPFAIGECGMPMEQARCPECGSPVGGSNHQAVTGVSRAMEMED
ncbi:hypothetical protein LTR47_011248 [Exophiala xenobiotica]|nr:hypothetical protein LTR92_010749 [Exophiala xenobiotica]KAK5202968.1 hypothetical protein LTR41_011286 [Exophiala xenobiotica]KAK5220305.1 hypothetical protein LTR47_011248 [Exophiala xenobiotica]KAK5247780.1 hypothetical protein LTS06_007083 [Exophiala xenobiotica]KAK5262054.1 hypothetical protein LTR40_000984 [Exophiala xenobiotica]